MKTTRREFLTTALAAATLPAEGSSVVADPLGPLNPLPNQRIRFQPTWDSIKQHQVPDWFHDAKLGLFPVWGIYSVPGWAPPAGELGKVDPKVWFHRNPYAEWYWNSMKIKDSPTWQHHVATYGANFKYEDFIPIFIREAKKWDPAKWADLFEAGGGKYVVFTTKFHDGYPLWPSRVPNPHRRVDQLASQRDYVGELTKAVRARGMKMGFYYSGGFDWTFEGAPIASVEDMKPAIPQTPEYAHYADAHYRELIDKYQPHVLWNDINYPKLGDLKGIFSEYYNKLPDGIINDRFGVEFSDFTTPEYTHYKKITLKKWEANRGVGFSFGYNQAEGPEHCLTAEGLVHLLVDVVSKNGNLLLAVGPKADGTIPEIQEDRVRALGKWLRVNGEAIYGTRPWVRAEGQTSDGAEVRFTRKAGALYAMLLAKPKGPTVTIGSLAAAENTTVQMLGVDGHLRWTRKGNDLDVALPDRLPGSHAWALKIAPEPRSLANG